MEERVFIQWIQIPLPVIVNKDGMVQGVKQIQHQKIVNYFINNTDRVVLI